MFDTFTASHPDPFLTGSFSPQGIFVFGIVWGIGASTDEDGRAKFESLFRSLIKKKAEQDEKDEKERHEKINHPAEGSLYNYNFIKEVKLRTKSIHGSKCYHSLCVCLQGPGNWDPWENELKNLPPIPREMQMNQIIVPTVDTVRYIQLMKILITHEKPMLFVGPTGTGKSVYITVQLSYKYS